MMVHYNVTPTEKFNKDVEYYYRKKKYKSVGEDIKRVTDQLENGNLIGNEATIFLLTIYSKKDDRRIPSDTEIVRLIKKYC